MIEPGYVKTMARYNAWQNKQLKTILDPMSHDDLIQDRGAFFGSIMQTLSHLLWGDQIWMSRFYDRVSPPETAPTESATHVQTLAEWDTLRFPLDGHIRIWANQIRKLDLLGDISWYSGAAGREMGMSTTMCIVGFFNHQTHHRGQVHAMLTAAGFDAPVSDIPLMPED